MRSTSDSGSRSTSEQLPTFKSLVVSRTSSSITFWASSSSRTMSLTSLRILSSA